MNPADIKTGPAEVQLQVGPDGLNWLYGGPVLSLEPGRMVALVPALFSGFARLIFISTSLAHLHLWFHAQV